MKKVLTTFIFLFGYKLSLAQFFLIQASGPVDVCYPSTVTLSVVSPQSGYDYNWFLGGYGCPNSGSSGPYAFGTSMQAMITGEFYCTQTPTGGGFPQFSNPITVRVLPGMPGSLLMPAPGLFTGNYTCVTSASLCIPAIYYQNWSGTIIKWYKNSVQISGASSGSYTATSEGYYKYTITSGCMTALSDSTHVTTPPSASITAGGSTAFCTGSSVTLNATTGAGFTWQWKNDATAITGATTSSYTATAEGSYTCAITNSCGSSTSNTISVTITSPPTATITPSGSTNICTGSSVILNANTGSGFSYLWKLNSSDISGATASSYSASSGGSYTVSITNSCGSATSSAVAVTVSTSVPAQPGTITATGGNTKVCPGETKTYSINAVSGATSYMWTPPVGAVITIGQGTTSVTVNYTSNFTATDTLHVRATNGCGNSPQRTLKITRNNPAKPSVITGQNYGVCNLTGVPYSVTNVAGITYNWSFSVNTAAVSTGQGSNSITADFGAGYISGTLSVTANNGCGTSPTRTLNVYAKPATPASITGATSVCANQQNVPYSIAAIPFSVNYTWIGPPGSHISDGIITSGGNTLITTATSVTVNYGSSSGNLKVRANNSCASGGYKSITISFVCRDSESESEMVFDADIFPNPNSGTFTIQFTNKPASPVQIDITDAPGRVIESFETNNEIAVINKSNLSDGIYYLTARNKDVVIVRKIVVH